MKYHPHVSYKYERYPNMQIFRKARWEKALGDRWWNRLPGAMLNLLTVSICAQG